MFTYKISFKWYELCILRHFYINNLYLLYDKRMQKFENDHIGAGMLYRENLIEIEIFSIFASLCVNYFIKINLILTLFSTILYFALPRYNTTGKK